MKHAQLNVFHTLAAGEYNTDTISPTPRIMSASIDNIGYGVYMVILNVCHTLESTATISPTPRIMSAK